MEFIYLNSLNTELEKEWEEIENKNNLISPFQNLSWIKNYIFFNENNKKQKTKNYFVIVKKNQKIIVIFPLCVRNKYLKTLEYIGDPFNDINIPVINNNHIFEPKDILIIQKEIKKFFKKKVDCIIFKNQPNYFPNNQKNFFVFENILTSNLSYKINLNENYLTNIKKTKFWKDLFRRNKKYIVSNSIYYKSLETKEEKEKAFNFYLQFKYDQLERTYRRNYLKSELNKKFLKNFFLENKVFALMNKDNKIIACASCLLNNKILYYLFPTYNYIFNNFALGQQLINYIISDKSREFEIFDFTVGEEDYKKYWSNHNLSYYNSVFANNVKGYIFKETLKLKNVIKKNNFIYLNILKILRKKKTSGIKTVQ